MARHRHSKSVALCALLALAAAAHADDTPNANRTGDAANIANAASEAHPSWFSRFRDTEDGAFDLSDMLLTHKGVLPVPVIITEPAVGYGFGLALLYFTAPKRAASENVDESDASEEPANAKPKMSPPNITAVGGFITGTQSWGVGLVHFHTWDEDRIRYLGVIGKVNLHLNYYGLQGNANAYQLSGVALVQQILFRIANSPWYVGPRYTFFDSATRFDPLVPNGIHNFERDVRVGKGGIVVDYDTRDNIFYPSRGTYAEFEAEFARGGFGSSNAFEMQAARAYHWIELSPRWVLGLRVDTGFSQGDIPFFAQPYVNLRGVSDAKFQDRNQLTGELELRWNVTPRWAVLGFGGVGKAYGNLHSFSDAPTAFGFGTGFRYLIARKLGLSMGIDVAHGPGQNAFYIQVGSAWH
ncbi:Outer membrane protein/protective antigen OMA87 [Paraburkholderia tropica]|uniref:BamA/TamA family outer membrane protein n=1 Tax=Paraburkholderia tropica TaxID=92647 RepID=UPI001CAD13EA|nr:BamA/TamA family outer membrane protein [Paraburkholderia tropica]CAG9216398.1 Outer membrane protein/protective antigen OMA87 [Paraburkholderia tropica]